MLDPKDVFLESEGPTHSAQASTASQETVSNQHSPHTSDTAEQPTSTAPSEKHETASDTKVEENRVEDNSKILLTENNVDDTINET